MPAKNGAGNRLVSLGSSPAREYSLDKPTIAIGSHPKNDVVADHTTVSRRHAEFVRDAPSAQRVYVLRDVGSLNGTYLNRERIDQAELSNGDEVQIGKFRLVFLASTSAG